MQFWGNHYQAAISLTFDDGLSSQQKFALPAMDARSLRGTFYLNPRGREEDPDRQESWQEHLEPWIPVQQNGHEIGNHTVMHPCSLNINAAWLKTRRLQEWTLERIEADILLAQERINAVFPEQKVTSFAYPCYESDVGHGANRRSYTPIIARHFVGARARGEYDNDPRYCDLHHLSSWASERMSGAQLIGLVELTLAAGRWGIFTFHGVNEGHLPIGETDFIELLDHLVRRKNEVWVAPVAEVASFINKQK